MLLAYVLQFTLNKAESIFLTMDATRNGCNLMQRHHINVMQKVLPLYVRFQYHINCNYKINILGMSNETILYYK